METENGARVPGGIYLCQVDEGISCGACCGLYNLADTGFEAMRSMLAHRTERFAHTPRNVDAIVAFKTQIEQRENQSRPFPKFHHCPYIGLIGERFSRVGCLLHPVATGNNRVDFRGLSYYGGMACREYFCPATHRLPARYKEIVRTAAENWHQYGLVVTERRLVGHLFEAVEDRLGRRIQAADLVGTSRCLAAIRELLRLKLDWPFRGGPDGGTRCHYIFEDGDYERPETDYSATGRTSSGFNGIMRELSTFLPDPASYREACELIKTRLDRVVDGFSQEGSGLEN